MRCTAALQPGLDESECAFRHPVERTRKAAADERAVAAVRQFGTRAAEPGTRFHYSSADSQVLGMVVSRAVGMPLPQYFSRRLWAPLGAEANAAWDTDAAGEALGFCCVVARLRDWARLGLMIAHDGRWNGRQVVSRPWIVESTSAAPGLSPASSQPRASARPILPAPTSMTGPRWLRDTLTPRPPFRT